MIVAAVLERLQQLVAPADRLALVGVHVNVSPSTPSVSASCADAKPPPSSRSSRSTYSTVSSAISR